MKRLLFLFLPLLLGLVSCGDDDKKELPEIIKTPNYEWLKNNIQGEWYATKTFNSVRNIWVSTSWGFSKNSFNFSDGEVEIKDFNTMNGVHSYYLYVEDGHAMIDIGGNKIDIFSIDPTEKEVELHKFAILVKR